MTAQQATVQIFLKAFHGLTKAQQHIFLEELLSKAAYREDLLDIAVVEARRHEAGRPLRDYIAQRQKRHHS